MAIGYTQEYEKLILLDLRSDSNNYGLIKKLLVQVKGDLSQIKEFLDTKKDRLPNLEKILEFFTIIELEEIELNEYEDTRDFQLLQNYIREIEVTIDELVTNKVHILILYEKLSVCRYIKRELIRKLKKEGFETVAAILRELQTLTSKPVLKYLLAIYDSYKELLDIEEDLEREKRKYEHKLQKGEQKILLEELRQSRNNYSKDTILLIQGLLETEGNYYHMLKGQLEEQYNQIIQNKLVQLNKLVNMQEKVLIDEQKVKNILKEQRKKFIKNKKYILG